jgi:hypothetical protein
MISDRPKILLADAAYNKLPIAPYNIDWSSVAELMRTALLDLRGIQPQTQAMLDAAGGQLDVKPSEGEIALFQKRGTKFQLVSMVISLIPAGEEGGVRQLKPFAATLIPASKRNLVQTADIDLVSKLDVEEWLKTQPLYTGYDPFSGGWSLYGSFPGYFDEEREGHLDEIGIVLNQFFLATDNRNEKMLMEDVELPSEETTEKYSKHRRKLFFAPFQTVRARRIWGVESPIELFLLQALAKEQLYPETQTLIANDGAAFPSMFHLWRDSKFRNSADIISSVDLYFPDQRVVIFCDGSSHSRRDRKEKDAAIDAKLEALGIKVVRIPGSEIKFELEKAVARVKTAIEAVP